MSKPSFGDGHVYDFYKPRAAKDTALSDWPPSLARQEFAEECDINVIMSRYERTGQLPVPGYEPRYIDMTGMPGDYQSALEMLRDAEEAFMRLPAVVRREFENDPSQFVAFASDAENLDQMRTWGLAPALQEPAATPAPVEPVAASAPSSVAKPA